MDLNLKLRNTLSINSAPQDTGCINILYHSTDLFQVKILMKEL